MTIKHIFTGRNFLRLNLNIKKEYKIGMPIPFCEICGYYLSVKADKDSLIHTCKKDGITYEMKPKSAEEALILETHFRITVHIIDGKLSRHIRKFAPNGYCHFALNRIWVDGDDFDIGNIGGRRI